MRPVPAEAPRLAPVASIVGLGPMTATTPSMQAAVPHNIPSLAPALPPPVAPLDVYLGLHGEGLLPYDEAKKNATIIALANTLKVQHHQRLYTCLM